MGVSVSAAEAATKPVAAPKPAATPTTNAATKPAATTKPAAAVEAGTPVVADALTNTVDPFDMADQKLKFLKAAGKTGELDAKTFDADRKAGGNLIMPFEKWETAVAFDKNKNATLDWFEFEAYRQAMRKAVLAACDKDNDNKLTGDERTAALKRLTDGKLVIKPDPERVVARPSQAGPTEDGEPGRRGVVRVRVEGEPFGPPKYTPRPEELQRWDLDGDGELNDEEMATMLHDQAWDFTPEPMQEFALRNFDADGDGRIDRAEWQAYRAFTAELSNSYRDWMTQMMGLDKDATPEQIGKTMQPIVNNVMQALQKRAKPDDGEPEMWYQSENMKGGWVADMAIGQALYILRFERQALADHGGTASDATRAALRKAYEADMRQRIEKADVGNKGRLTREEAENFLIDLMDDYVKEGYDYGQSQKKNK